MSGIYDTKDTITPSISFHKSVVVNGGVVAKSASIGNDKCKLVVNDEGVWIRLPSNFDDNGNLSEPGTRDYNLGAIVEAIQELNRRTAWMEPDITLSESLEGNDAFDDNATIRPGVLYNGVTDHLPGLKRTVPDGNHFRLINTNGDVIRYYHIDGEYSDILGEDESLVTNGENGSLTKLRSMISGDEELQYRFISPRILKNDDGSFDILVLDTIDVNDRHSTLSDAYYIYTPILTNLNAIRGYKVSLKKDITTEKICPDGSKVIPPIPYIYAIRKPIAQTDSGSEDTEQPSYIIAFPGLFTDRTGLTNAIDLSNWDFSKIIDIGYMFKGCTGITSIDFGNNKLDTDINTDFMFEGASELQNVIFHKNYNTATSQPIYPAFISTTVPDELYILEDGRIMDKTGVTNYDGVVWKTNDNEANYWRFSYTMTGDSNAQWFFLTESYKRVGNMLTKN